MDMQDLEAKLQAANQAGARIKLIATDGVFSMDGDVAPLKDIVSLARRYGSYVFVDDCHATGFVGATGRGSDEFAGVQGGADIINSTLGKALGGATGGFWGWQGALGGGGGCQGVAMCSTKNLALLLVWRLSVD